MDINSLYKIYKKFPIITTDSRNIPSKSLFFALKGENFNGNRFAEEAIHKGAAFAIVDESPSVKNDKIIQVDNVLDSLQLLANHHRNQLGIPILAITGTNGKTTTKELISAVLARKYKVSATKGNFNNHIGVPLTLLAMDKSTQFGVVEMGANHPGEIKALCEIANPDFGMITNIGKAHLEGFGSFQGVIKTKSEMYDFIRAKNGKCFLNSDNPILVKQADKLDLVKYGTADNNFLSGEIAGTGTHLVIKALFPKGWLYLKSNLIGNYNFENLLAAACIGKYFDVDPLKIQEAIAEYIPSNNRSQLIQKEKNTIIMDAYNANPTSMMAAIKNFVDLLHPNKCLILGDMLELGITSNEEHQQIVDYIDTNEFDDVFLIGSQFKKTTSRKQKKKFEQVELLSNYLKTQPIENKLILIKGSRGIHLERILEFLP